jgi:hypothetical protein
MFSESRGASLVSRIVSRAVLVPAFVGVLLSACASDGDISNPVARRVTWYSYLNGDDIRAACAPGAPDHLRAVFNGVYSEDVRIHEVQTNGGVPVLSQRKIGPADLTTLLNITGFDSAFDPWRGTVRSQGLSEAEWATLRETLARDGLNDPPPKGLELVSDRFYWVVVGCLDGAVVFNAWADPSERYTALRFPDALVSLVRPKDPLPRYEVALRGSLEAKRRKDFLFRLRVEEGGLRDGLALPNPLSNEALE